MNHARVPAMDAYSGTRRGQSTVELALLLPLMLLVCVGIVDFGRVYYYDIVIINAARVGARIAADTRTTDGAVVAAVQADAAPVTPTSITITPSGTRTSGADVTVTVNYIFAPMVGTILNFSGQTLHVFQVVNLSRSATMVAF